MLFEKLGVIQVDESILIVCFADQEFGPCVVAYEMLLSLRETVLWWLIIKSMGRAVIALLEEEPGNLINSAVILFELPQTFHLHEDLLEIPIKIPVMLGSSLE
jgi:hypothetical protein